jgi:predicted transcriptional regulator of viral defense system
MKFNELLLVAGKEPCFTSGMLLAGKVSPATVRLQLSRWTKEGKIIQLRKGLYTLAKPYASELPHKFYLANQITRPSYVSLQSGLAHYGLIPENVPAVTSITTARPGQKTTLAGTYIYRHIKPGFFTGYSLVPVYRNQSAFIASPEKCLLDLVHLTPQGDTKTYLDGLRLQELDTLQTTVLEQLVRAASSPKLARALKIIIKLIAAGEYKTL